MKKILSFISLSMLLFVSVAFTAPEQADAAVFPMGCSSGLGYSTTNGLPCNGTSTATMQVAGCSSALGYSITTGTPCSGGSEALLLYLNGCSSSYGYSTISGLPCNGTATVSFDPGTVVVTPGLPTTGAGARTSSTAGLLAVSGILALSGIAYLARRNKVSVAR